MQLQRDKAHASPNKAFFVSMLTRDIELQDAILDLLDNCVDGLQRSTKGRRVDPNLPYKGYFARLIIRPDMFRIRDNCGGIPPGEAKDRAFMMGRPSGVDDGLATVGRYGIGMKRAIFKLGKSAEVFSKHGNHAFRVDFTREWMDDPNDWDLPMLRMATKSDAADGTRITIQDLRDEVADRFDTDNDNFLSEFGRYVSRYYSLIISKGFQVFINSELIEPAPFLLFDTPPSGRKEKGIEPYILRTTVDGVRIEIYAGLFRPIPSDQELEKERDSKVTREESGWTIACNDRVVLYRDRTHVTGWGTGGVPSWHGQFMAFGGVLLLSSNDVTKLPLTTTKRGIDVSSRLYAVVLDYMREATKLFTAFTNKWKKAGDELTAEVFSKASTVGLTELRQISQRLPATAIRKFGPSTEARLQRPDLPLPKDANRNVRISYEKARDEVAELAEYLFEDRNTEPKTVGSTTFDRALRTARKRSA